MRRVQTIFGAQRAGAGETNGDVNRPARSGGFGHSGGVPFGFRLRFRRAVRRYASGHQVTCHGNQQVDGDGPIRCYHRVVDAKQVEAREQASEDGAGGVAAVEQTPPGDAAGSGFNPPDDRGQRRAHQNGRRQQADGAQESTRQHAGQAKSGAGDINPERNGRQVRTRNPQTAIPASRAA